MTRYKLLRLRVRMQLDQLSSGVDRFWHFPATILARLALWCETGIWTRKPTRQERLLRVLRDMEAELRESGRHESADKLKESLELRAEDLRLGI